MKTLWNELKKILETKEMPNEFENRAIEIIQTGKQRKKYCAKNKPGLRDLWEVKKLSNINVTGVLKEEKKQKMKQKKY